MFEDFITNKDSWLSGRGPESEIIFSSRIRLARNISGCNFPLRNSEAQKSKTLATVREICPHIKLLKNSIFVAMEDVDDLDSQLLLERHLISQEHKKAAKGKGLIVSRNEEISIMINEEDFLRMQVISSGFDLKHCWDVLDSIDSDFSRRISFAFLADLGYLTACPTNVGTGMRASCMLHLPALMLTKRINKILELLSRISFTARGLFGEGTQALGNFFQISNQVSLGVSEEELIDNLIGVVNQVKDQEIASRELLRKKYKMSLADNVWRALGILRNCRLINSKEALSHLSILSLGLDLGIIKSSDLATNGQGKELINSLFLMIQPAHLQKMEGKPLKESERDHIRAEFLRKALRKQ
jgi:protein arginine kinase